MDHSRDAFLKVDKGAVLLDGDDLAAHVGANGEAFFDLVPGIFGEALAAQRHLAGVGGDVEDLQFNFGPRRQSFCGAFATVPGNFLAWNEAVHGAEFHEDAKIKGALHLPLHGGAGDDFVEEVLAGGFAAFEEELAARQHGALASGIVLQHVGFDFLALQLVQVGNLKEVNLAGGHEGFEADVHHDATLYDAADGATNGNLVFEGLLDVLLRLLCAGKAMT